MTDQPVSGWGCYPKHKATIHSPQSLSDIHTCVQTHTSLTPRGLGRSYGDSSLGDHLLNTQGLAYLNQLDTLGRLTCEAGVSFVDILSVIVPQGWFLPVTPGTQYVTVGGAIASDIHGKNHHQEGSFCDHLYWIELLGPDGTPHRCSKDENPDLFHATCAGMGLTGLITKACFQLKKIESSVIRRHTYKAPNLDHLLGLIRDHSQFTYSVAWIDCLARGSSMGRGILFCGEHATPDQLSLKQQKNPLKLPHKKGITVPFSMPKGLLNAWSLRSFNALYYHLGRTRQDYCSLTSYFYPLDGLQHWNRLYGKAGFIQYQCVLPTPTCDEGIRALITELSQAGQGSFLAVLKAFGPGNDNLLSFPHEGLTLALDIPYSNKVHDLTKTLDAIVTRYDGRLYLTKDALMTPDLFQATYPKLEQFKTFKNTWDPEHRFWSHQSHRLGLTERKTS